MGAVPSLDWDAVEEAIGRALREDVGAGDITTLRTVPGGAIAPATREKHI